MHSRETIQTVSNLRKMNISSFNLFIQNKVFISLFSVGVGSVQYRVFSTIKIQCRSDNIVPSVQIGTIIFFVLMALGIFSALMEQ